MGDSEASRSCADELSNQFLFTKAYDGDVGALSSIYIGWAKALQRGYCIQSKMPY